MFKAYHEDFEHQGRDRTLSLMKRRLYWPGMDWYVESKIKQCGRCIRRKVLPTRAADPVNIISTAPMEVVCIDSYHRAVYGRHRERARNNGSLYAIRPSDTNEEPDGTHHRSTSLRELLCSLWVPGQDP